MRSRPGRRCARRASLGRADGEATRRAAATVSASSAAPRPRPSLPTRRAGARCDRAWSRGSVTCGSPVGKEPGEQDTRLDLGARHRHPVGDPVKRAPGESSGGSRPSRHATSAPIWSSGSAIRSTGRRRIDSSPSSVHSPLPCPASQPGRSRSSVPALPTSMPWVPSPARSPGPRSPMPRDPEIERARMSRLPHGDVSPELLDRTTGRLRVGRVQVALHLDLAVAHRADQGRAVADRLVRRWAELAPERSRGREPRHLEIETVWPRPRTISAARSDSASPATQRETAPVRMSGAG